MTEKADHLVSSWHMEPEDLSLDPQHPRKVLTLARGGAAEGV